MENNYFVHSLIFGKRSTWFGEQGCGKKLQRSEIKGKCFKVIFNMYTGVKSCVQYNCSQSDFFPCLTGVRQGENLSPFPFSIFLSDLENFFVN
jgi:hypothetical protein